MKKQKNIDVIANPDSENAALSKALKEVDRTKFVTREEVMKKLKSKNAIKSAPK